MARLRGEITTIDLMKPFSVRSGGRVIDLSKDLHFEVQWDGSNVVERFTGDVLGGSGHAEEPGPANHTGSTISGSSYFPNLVPNISWANDEFTISFWVKFNDVGFTNDYFGVQRQIDFIAARSSSTSKRFSTYLKRITGNNVRAYFGYSNTSSPTDLLFNFCDTYDNEFLINKTSFDHSKNLSYPSEYADERIIPFNSWNHIILRNKVSKNGSLGVCDLWVDGKLRSKYIPVFANAETEKQELSKSPGSAVLSEKDLMAGGSIDAFTRIITDKNVRISSPYPLYLPRNNDRLYLSNHAFFQIAKWDRLLNEYEIKDLYNGTLNGVYVERKFSMSTPPRKILNNNKINESYGPYDDVKTITGEAYSYLGKNQKSSTFSGDENLELGQILESSVIQRNFENKIIDLKTAGFTDSISKDITDCIDGTKASAIIKIDISSIERNDNLQYAGRVDSQFAKTVSNKKFSMFLSSALYRHDRISEDYIPDGVSIKLDTGIAGTGFLYFSPTKKVWIEKRANHSTSYGLNTQNNDLNDAVNAIEINPHTSASSDGGFILPYETEKYNKIREVPNPPYLEDSDIWYSSKLQITGTNEIMRQFTASPQLGYFTSKKEYLKKAGYENIGSPTVTFGAPFSPKYHAFSDETIRLNEFIDGPFQLKKAILKIPVEIQRINEINEGQYLDLYKPVAYFNFEATASSPSTVPDLTGNGHVATLLNTSSVILSDTPGDLTGRGCLDLTYNSPSTSDIDALVINDAADLRMNATGLSISFWVKFSDFTVGLNHSLIYKVSSSGNDAEYYLFYDRVNNALSFRINDVASSIYTDRYVGRKVTSISSTISDVTKWYHIVVACDGNTTAPDIKIYIDGVRKDNSNDNFSPSYSHSNRISSNDVYIGSRGLGSAATDLRGKIACLTFWDRQLEQQDADFLYTSCINSIRYSWNWTENITMRKDMDNYVFFLYRQRRANSSNSLDSLQDISSSARFLIGSGSVCVYNSSSFGLASRDGFIDQFGVDTPIFSSYSPGTSRNVELNEMFRSASIGKDPITFENLEEIVSPLHTPAISLNTALEDFSNGGTYIEKKYLEIQIDPAYVLGGYPNNTLMYVTTSKGHLSTSFYSKVMDGYYVAYDPVYSNRLFNWYPQKGTNADLDTSSTPPITTIFQNLWFGGTAQPVVATNARGNFLPPGSIVTASIVPYFQFDNRSSLLTGNSNLQESGKTQPEFDIEIARLGLSIFNLKENIFEKQLQLIIDGRSIPSSFEKNANPGIAAVFQRTELLQATSYNDETTNYITGTFSIASGLKDASFIDLIASLTTGYAPSSPNAGRNVYNPYILLPEDELILGLDAGITPPPDIAPYSEKNLTDYNPNGGHKPKQNAFINSVLKEQIWHYAGNSYMRILPGSAELILVGDYISNGEKIEKVRKINSPNISTIIGNDPVFDQYDNAEVSAYVGTYQSQVITGSMSNNTRAVDYDAASRVDSRSGTVGRFVVASNSTISLLDQYISGVLR